MELLGAVLLAASLLGTAARGAQAPWPDEPSHTCFFQTLSSPDSEFCRGDLEVTYPQLGDVGCSYIPQCHQYRWRLSREWGSPRVRYPRADKSKKYVLMLVDPDAPSRADPRNRFWRHWLLADVRGTDLRTGDLKGRVLTDYVRPTPPPRSGYHRYQLRLYEQPAGQHIALGPEELLSLGKEQIVPPGALLQVLPSGFLSLTPRAWVCPGCWGCSCLVRSEDWDEAGVGCPRGVAGMPGKASGNHLASGIGSRGRSWQL
uniref:Phosphatidylethanolamine binding protein 4 n=1 Tax=Anser cygnoides TaxID=8845 RepID=A0A8B9EM23_ANSCY